MSPSKTILSRQSVILMGDDDEDDIILAREAFSENRMTNDVRFVRDGQELMDYLFQRGAYQNEDVPRPDLILLDLNMPRKDGWQAHDSPCSGWGR